MLKDYPKFERGEIEEFYEKLPDSEKKLVNDYLKYRQARGVESEDKLKDIRRYMLHIRAIIGNKFNSLDNIDNLRSLIAIINTTKNLSDTVKNNLKIDLRNFLKYLFDDWSKRFREFEDVKTHGRVKNENKINSKNLFKKEDIKKVMQHEKDMFWKAFFITQYEAALRTIETRLLKWNDITFDIDEDISEINIYATKTKRARTVFVKESTFYLKKLKEEQSNLGIKTVYVFPQKSNPNIPTSKTTVSDHFKPLFEKSLGSHKWNYLLRHSRGTELYTLAKENKIAKDTVIQFMGHSEDMSDFYTHLDTKSLKEMMKNQVYHLEDLPEEKKNELQEQIDKLNKKIEKQNELLYILAIKEKDKLKGQEKEELEEAIKLIS